MSNKTNFNGINISWKYNGIKAIEVWNNQKVYAYTVTINNPATGKSARFPYYERLDNKEGVINWYDAFYCILSSAIFYDLNSDFWNFCDVLGYNYDSSEKIYNLYKSTYNRINRVLNGNLNNYFNEFMEVYGDKV